MRPADARRRSSPFGGVASPRAVLRPREARRHQRAQPGGVERLLQPLVRDRIEEVARLVGVGPRGDERHARRALRVLSREASGTVHPARPRHVRSQRITSKPGSAARMARASRSRRSHHHLVPASGALRRPARRPGSSSITRTRRPGGRGGGPERARRRLRPRRRGRQEHPGAGTAPGPLAGRSRPRARRRPTGRWRGRGRCAARAAGW